MFLLVAMVFTACGNKMEERVEKTFDSGKPQYVRYYQKEKGEESCVKEIEYYESGQVKMEGALKDGHREGRWIAYFENGKVQSEGFFKDGLRSDAAKVFYENGNKYMEGFYKEGKHCGQWKYYDESGNLLREVDYGE